MLLMFTETYFVNIAFKIKPTYINKQVFSSNSCEQCLLKPNLVVKANLFEQTRVFACLFAIKKKNYNILFRRKCSLKVRFKKVVKNLPPNDAQF